ncbi:MAG: glutamate-5-semialdehyde dehydrogenase, partial [Candidatus Firestonebacteria bacterium]|nr:glutamate-5-semialdehyde dehydrogenase [Candidatus Firestonebacteria bacterium]
ADAGKKNQALICMADHILSAQKEILTANTEDLRQAQAAGISGAMLDRLSLNEARIQDMARGLREVAALPDPVGELESEWVRPNGMRVGRMRVPLGVVGIVYEARPNVTADAAGLCLKAGNASILRGGSESIASNRAIGEAIAAGLRQAGLPPESVQVIPHTDRQAVSALITQQGLVDCIIPRGGHAFLAWVAQNASVPVIQHGEGNCHVYVDDPADLTMAEEIVFNGKVQRPGVCNATETLLVHAQTALAFLPAVLTRLAKAGVEIRGCEQTRILFPGARPAVEADWSTEFLDLILAVKVVSSFADALDHIARYGTGHSEAIVTRDYGHAERFLKEVDAAAVLVNASTRLVDGGQFGLGAEIGISTQKLHARGPMGLRELTSLKFVVRGSGQIRK